MTEEKRKQMHEDLTRLTGIPNLSVENMDAITRLRDMVDTEDESEGMLKEWEAKYKGLEEKLQSEIDSKNVILDAYRRRWDESMNGTKVNGRYVDKTVTDVTDYDYDRLLGIK